MSFDSDEGRWMRVMSCVRYLAIKEFEGQFMFRMSRGRIRRATLDDVERLARTMGWDEQKEIHHAEA